jgi:hypothetical protein
MAFSDVRPREDHKAYGLSAVVASSFADDAAAQLRDGHRSTVGPTGRLQLGAHPGSDAYEWIAITTPADDSVPPLRINYVAAALDGGSNNWPDAFSSEFVVEGGHYAVFVYQGPHDGLDEFYRATYNDELPQLAMATRDGQHLER